MTRIGYFLSSEQFRSSARTAAQAKRAEFAGLMHCGSPTTFIPGTTSRVGVLRVGRDIIAQAASPAAVQLDQACAMRRYETSQALTSPNRGEFPVAQANRHLFAGLLVTVRDIYGFSVILTAPSFFFWKMS